LAYKVLYDEKIQDDLRSLDRAKVRRILDRIEAYLSEDPRHRRGTECVR